ncbi:peptidoglycan DD-metalloendopeptidase family protein [Paenibacillus mucilaginosus]|uniref:Peptidase M23 n=1 Tax=Paenibacillus mucilaginosus (strain KNP414) TaxID=1036673 RepID=F8FJ73_PAEMK|nr:M23 family metallopeptidase [Paenibacillus mucilaginosus]AEI38786.1 Peptidase M23 [Paenibacillus mucilaginosus KNP414]MCG7215920.1 peptidoglycan DD-metalloendopeptidase family protein [Paenibacillus mucilaginosus]
MLSNKPFVPFVVAAGLVGMLIAPQSGIAASETQRIQNELNQLRQQKNAYQKKQAETDKQIAQVQNEKARTESDLDALMGQIDSTNTKLNQLNEQIYTVKTSLEQNAVELDEAEVRIETRDQLLKSRLRLMYMNGAVSYADVLLSSTSFSDFLDRLQALQSIVSQDKDILEANKRDHKVIADKRVVIEQKLAEVKTLYGQVSEIKADLVEKEKEKEVRIASLSQQEEQLEHINEEIEQQVMAAAAAESKKQQALFKEQQRVAREAEAARKKNNTSNKGVIAPPQAYAAPGGKFGYPLRSYVSKSSDFGSRRDPITGRTASHSGVDLPAPNGTDILAAEDGVVIMAQSWSGYGNTVMIDHGGGIWTLYGHIRNGGIAVEKGETVKKGQKIAEVGSTGRSTGNHLHFEVRINGNPVNPNGYIGQK